MHNLKIYINNLYLLSGKDFIFFLLSFMCVISIVWEYAYQFLVYVYIIRQLEK